MKTTPFQYFSRKPKLTGVLMFFVLMLLTQFIAYERYLLVRETEEQELINEANTAQDRLQNALSYSRSTAQTLGFIVEQYGVPDNFDSVGNALLQSNKFIDAVQLVQGGIITHVVPLTGNEVVIGFNILKDSARNSGALHAIATKKFFWAGPFELKQGGVGIVGRQPLYKANNFWGFSAVIIKLPNFLKTVGIDSTANHGFSYQLSKINSDKNFLPEQRLSKTAQTISVKVPDVEWKLMVSKKNKTPIFFAFTFSLIGFILSLTGGLFAWFMAQQPQRLNKLVEEKTVALLASENNLFNTLERVSDAFVAIDTNFCYTYMNKKAGEIFHRDQQAIVGKNMWEEFPDWVDKPFHKVFIDAIKNQQYVLLEEYYPKQSLWFESRIYPSSNGLSVFIQDITDRKKAEQEILREKNLSDSIINSLPGIFYLINLDGQMLRWNKSIEIVSGYSAEEIDHMRARDFIALDDQETVLLNKSLAIQSGESGFEANFYTKQKQYIPYQFTSVLSEYNGQPCLLGLGIDIKERKKAEEEIVLANTSLRSLSSHLQTIREEERTAISRELHDELGQQLTALKMDIIWIGKKLNANDVLLKEKIAESSSLVDDTVKTIRRINTELRPGILDDLGLCAALDWQAKEFTKRTGITCNIQICENEPVLDKNTSINIFRIFQETLTNITRHSSATEVNAALEIENKTFLLTIHDNGIGFDAEEVKQKKSFGMLGIKERALAINAAIEIVTQKGEGTTIKLILPIIN